jgi:enamine deaminase RidA (YjgF/YER057c/UK114 family)
LLRLTDRGAADRSVMGMHFLTMSLVVQVVALVEDEARVEIEATAVVPK